MDTKGGRITLEVNGQVYSARGEAKIKSTPIKRTNGVNQDGSGYSTVEAQLYSVELTFDRGVNLPWNEQTMLATVNVTLVEKDTTPARTHLFTNANWEGAPEISTKDGEVSGLSFMTDKYQVT